MADETVIEIDSDPQDLVAAAVWMLRGAGVPYLEAMSMVKHMATTAWESHWSENLEDEQLPN